ncbi:MAG: protease modulator HflC [Gammaproteobacteria bacterium]|nr:protease modulator HflC [Gammaproteobacteria bacterium]MDE2349594.1 protease modulator HflC [Gammaproteobacteria bacterium]
MQNRVLYILLAAVASILILRASVFTVGEGQLAIKSVGGEIVDSNYQPGLHFKIPIINEVAKFDKRIITQFYPSERFLTHEQEQLNVDFYVKWRIDDLRRYYESTGGSEDVANARLGETIKDSIKSVVTQRTLQQVITADRAEFTQAMMKNARPSARELGVQLVDVRITKIDLPAQVRDSVFDRMRATFKAQAAKLRAEGAESAEATRAEASKEQTEILADAASQADQIRGAGDAAASGIYAKAYSKDPEFYAFYRSMRAYKDSIGTPGDVLVLSPDSAFFKYFKQPQAQR